MKTTAWHWPDHVIGKRESRRLREEHNDLYNSHAELGVALQTLLDKVDRKRYIVRSDFDFFLADAAARTAIAKATGG